MGAAIAESWLPKFMIPPKVPTLSRGAISDGTDQHTGAAADSPPIATLIHVTAPEVLCAYITPSMPRPNDVPAIRIVCRTREASRPRCTSLSTNQPPTSMSAHAATSHGRLV